MRFAMCRLAVGRVKGSEQRGGEESRALLAREVFPHAPVDQGEARLDHGRNDTLRLPVAPIHADFRGAQAPFRP